MHASCLQAGPLTEKVAVAWQMRQGVYSAWAITLLMEHLEMDSCA